MIFRLPGDVIYKGLSGTERTKGGPFMLLLEASNIKKFYGDRLIISFDDLKIYTGDRIGVTGLNGSGKTTLLDILSGSLEPDEGIVRRYCRPGYIRQFDGIGDDNDTRYSVIDEKRTAAAEQISDTTVRLLKEFDLARKLDRADLSGGEKTRLKIAGVFGEDNVLVFADEPTSNLDHKGIELLKRKLESLESFVLISHDRELLDSLCNRIIEVRDGRLRSFAGNFSFYRQQCEMERERAVLEYEKYIAEKTALEAAISDRRRRAKKVRKAPGRMGNSEARLHKRQANESQEKLHNAANSLISRLEKLEVKQKPREQPSVKMDFSLTEPPENKVVISADRLSFSYGKVPVFRSIGFEIQNGMKTALWGENGSGKTTLLNLIYAAWMDAHPGKGAKLQRGIISGDAAGSINIVPKAKLGYFSQTFENLSPEETVLQNVMKESIQNETVARTILARLLIQGDAVFRKVGVISGGEKIKTAFAKLFVSEANVLLLDEPTNYLDMQSIEALENVLKDYEGTVLFVSHDKAFVRAVADRLLILGDLTVKSFSGSLDEYEESLKERERPKTDELELTIIRMKMSEIIGKLSVPNCDKEALEAEYQRLAGLLKEMQASGLRK